MNKKVLIISSSPRKGGNSETLAAAFAKGAREAGNPVETVYLREKQVGFCKGCLACLNLGHCVIQDDAVEIAAKMHDANVLVFATPVYYYCVSGQLKTMLDRANPLFDTDYAIVTVVALMAQGLTDSSFQYHLTTAKNNGVTKTEIAEILTHAAFYAGWPKAWAAFRMAKEVWAEDNADDAKDKHQNEMVFPIGAPNDGFAKYFIGQSYLAPLSTQQVGIYNVTFEPGCRNNWHIHHAKNGGGQILVCVAGRGYYQEWGKPAQELRPGDVVNIPVGVKHWHGAAPDSWFSHLAVEVPGDETSNEWLEAVDNTVYFKATGKEV